MLPNKVLLIHNHLGDAGGAETHFMSLIAELRKCGFDVYTFTLSARGVNLSPERDFVYWKAGRPRAWKLWRYAFHPGIYLALRRVLTRVRPDCVHLHVVEQPFSVLPALKGQVVLHSVHTAGLICATSLLTRRDDLKRCEGGIGLKCLQHRCVSPVVFLPNWYLNAIGNRLLNQYVMTFLPPSEHLAALMQLHGFQNVQALPLFISEDYYVGR